MPAEHVLMPIRNRHSLPAMAAGVIIHGRLAVIGAVGVRKADADVKVTRDDQFHIGSCTKAMTATLVALLVDQGKLRWDMTLPEALPELADTMNPAYRKATLRQLLCHRAGLVPNSPPGKSFGEYFNLPGTLRQQRLAYAREILKAEPQAAPGEKFIYSNAGFAIAGAIAERAADMEFHELMRKRLFEPLGMTSAGFGSMGTPDKLDQPFQHPQKDGKFVPVGPGTQSDNPLVISAAGRVHCSIADWAKFIEAHLAGLAGRPTPLAIKPETWKILHEAPHGGEYALGWSVAVRDWGGGQVFTHAGSNTMNYSVVWMAPKLDYAVLVATNQGGEDAFKACDEAAGALIRAFPPNSTGLPGTMPAEAGGGR
jgi:CubicO group peptidase (beta-lactamase class C family)